MRNLASISLVLFVFYSGTLEASPKWRPTFSCRTAIVSIALIALPLAYHRSAVDRQQWELDAPNRASHATYDNIRLLSPSERHDLYRASARGWIGYHFVLGHLAEYFKAHPDEQYLADGIPLDKEGFFKFFGVKETSPGDYRYNAFVDEPGAYYNPIIRNHRDRFYEMVAKVYENKYAVLESTLAPSTPIKLIDVEDCVRWSEWRTEWEKSKK